MALGGAKCALPAEGGRERVSRGKRKTGANHFRVDTVKDLSEQAASLAVPLVQRGEVSFVPQ